MYNQPKHKERKQFCIYCLQCFSSETILAKHTNGCLTINGKRAINMPEKGENILKFNNFHKQLPVPFVIYADFEAITKKVQGCRPNDNKSYTEAYQTHEDCGYGYEVVCCYKDARARGHCHVTGKFRGSAHQECNLKLRIKPEDIKIPVIFHNLRGYDSHFIMQQIGQIAKNHAYKNKKRRATSENQCHTKQYGKVYGLHVG